MRQTEMLRLSFEDELNKIAGEMQGFTRIGRRPIGVERLLEREREDADEMSVDAVKLSAVPSSALLAGAAIGGAGAYHLARKANQDRQMGRAMRLQQGAQSF